MTAAGALLFAIVAVGAPEARPKLSSLPEIIKRLEAIPTQVRVESLDHLDLPVDQIAARLYPLVVPPVQYPQVVEQDGVRRIVKEPCDAAEAALAHAEEAFSAKNYPEAQLRYDQAVAKAPQCAIAVAYRGDASHFAGDYQTALTYYDRALKLNPDEGAYYLFRANALSHLGRLKEALDDLRWSLALRPHNANSLKMVRGGEQAMRVAVHDVPFVPLGFARKEGDSVAVYWDKTNHSWMGYALCKALWLADEEHRKNLTGEAKYQFSTTEELECLGALVTAWHGVGKDPHRPTDAQLSYLDEVVKSGDAPGWVIYEIASRFDPQIVLKLAPKGRQGVFDFVRRHVVVDAR